MKLSEIHEGIEPVEMSPDEATIGWYIVNSKNKIGAGPYASKSEAQADAKYFQWYKEREHEIVHGWVNEDDEFVYMEPDA